MKKNVGSLDRIIRLVLGAVCIFLYFSGTVTGALGIVLLVVSGVFITTALMSSCPMYSLLGVGTCKVKTKE